ncbi:hypothetical protein HRF87_08630 [Bacillus sp. CRN 9]|nr:hypothetical protein [Bacillus sp. CRN 9]
MNFFKGIAKVGKAILDEGQRLQEQRERQMNNAQRRASGVSNDRDLVKRFQNSSGVEKAAYGQELANRGYIDQGDDGNYKRTNKQL